MPGMPIQLPLRPAVSAERVVVGLSFEQTEMLDPTNIEGDKGGQMVTSMYGDMTVFFVD